MVSVSYKLISNVMSKLADVSLIFVPINSATSLSVKPYIMSKDINIKDCRKAVNRAKYNPTAERKAEALKLLKELTKAVANLEEVVPKAKAKPKAKRVKRKSSNQRLEESQAKDNVSTTYIPDAAKDVIDLPEYQQLRDMGYGVEDAVRYVNALMQGAPQVATSDCPF